MTASQDGAVHAPVSHELIDSTLVLTINAPERRNSLNSAVRAGIHAGLERAEHDRAVRAVVITGVGTVFSSGGDFVEDFGPIASGSRDDTTGMIDGYFELFGHIERCSVPVISAVNGAAVGGGLEMVMASDLAIASEDATFSPIEGRAVGTPSGWTLLRAAERLNHKAAAELVLTGRSMNARIALERGLINQVVPAGRLGEESLAWGASIALSTPHAVACSKAYLRARTRAANPAAVRDLVVAAMSTPESVQMIGTFFNRSHTDS